MSNPKSLADVIAEVEKEASLVGNPSLVGKSEASLVGKEVTKSNEEASLVGKEVTKSNEEASLVGKEVSLVGKAEPETSLVGKVETSLVRKLVCIKCHHQWFPRHIDVKRCPCCKTTRWKPQEPKKDPIGFIPPVILQNM